MDWEWQVKATLPVNSGRPSLVAPGKLKSIDLNPYCKGRRLQHTVFGLARDLMGFAIPYLHNGQPHDYVPDFIIRLKRKPDAHLILETKGYDPLTEIKAQAAKRWVDAVNAETSHGWWTYAVARGTDEVAQRIDESFAAASAHAGHPWTTNPPAPTPSLPTTRRG